MYYLTGGGCAAWFLEFWVFRFLAHRLVCSAVHIHGRCAGTCGVVGNRLGYDHWVTRRHSRYISNNYLTNTPLILYTMKISVKVRIMSSKIDMHSTAWIEYCRQRELRPPAGTPHSGRSLTSTSTRIARILFIIITNKPYQRVVFNRDERYKNSIVSDNKMLTGPQV